ncbi:hypothetical protein C3V36_12205 [Lachnospiraceae bacterium oral taxon 500]|nr:hypothetical protein C3V36_12205 [Lachnospiraceae bacterium oral taxon 500]
MLRGETEMNYVLTPEQMAAADKSASYDLHIPGIVLMENAAHAVLQEIRQDFPPDSRIAVIAGRGNNGGDGLALARQLFLHNYSVKIYLLAESDDLTPDATVNYYAAAALGIECEAVSRITETLRREWQTAALLVDALLGTGCNRRLGDLYYQAVETINQSPAPKYSIDIPSGLNGERGTVMGTAVRADKTIVLAAYKRGNLLGRAKEYCGEMVLADIELPPAAYDSVRPQTFVLNPALWPDFPPKRPFAHKGTMGRALVIAGSGQMGGALLLTAEAAYRSGAGLVYAYTAENNRIPLLTRLPEVIVDVYEETPEETDKYEFSREIEGKDAILIGPGLSTGPKAYELLRMTLASKLPLVIDADALTLLAEHPKLLHLCSQRTELKVLTPHLKEMERLTGLSVEQIEENSLDLAGRFAKSWNAVIVLKNYRTVIAFPDGKCYINPLGNEGMATGGSGDVLSGCLAGLLAGAAGRDQVKAILYGVYRHSLAGDLACRQKGPAAMLASDIIGNLGTV